MMILDTLWVAKTRLQNYCSITFLSHEHDDEHDDPMFPLHKLIAYMFLDIMVTFEEVVNF